MCGPCQNTTHADHGKSAGWECYQIEISQARSKQTTERRAEKERWGEDTADSTRTDAGQCRHQFCDKERQNKPLGQRAVQNTRNRPISIAPNLRNLNGQRADMGRQYLCQFPT